MVSNSSRTIYVGRDALQSVVSGGDWWRKIALA